MPERVPYVAVVGAGHPDETLREAARLLGKGLAEHGAVVVCGGLGGVMEGVCQGVAEAGGTSVGILPDEDRHRANRWATVTLPTGLGEARNALVVRAADVVVALGGEFGTLSEIALALRNGTPVVGLATWELAREGKPVDAIFRVDTVEAAADLAIELSRSKR